MIAIRSRRCGLIESSDMPTLHKKLADLRELNPLELERVHGGTDGEYTKDTSCYTDSSGRVRCVRGFD